MIRAISFYEKVFNIKIERVTMLDTELGIFPSEKQVTNIVLAKGSDYKPSADGVVIYLSMENDLQPVLGLVEANGGKIIVPKSEISPEMGFYALFLDTEGNRIGLHSRE
ncbi:VOC family protein [Leptospira sp. 96542]|nr:VOC family protein [Leptospira sp. 96542]